MSSANVCQLSFAIMVLTLLVLWYLLSVYRAALIWTDSIFTTPPKVCGSQTVWLYSKTGRMRVLHAHSFTEDCWYCDKQNQGSSSLSLLCNQYVCPRSSDMWTPRYWISPLVDASPCTLALLTSITYEPESFSELQLYLCCYVDADV